MKLYAIELLMLKTLEGETSTRAQHRLWKTHYCPILFKVPNRIEPKDMDACIDEIFASKLSGS